MRNPSTSTPRISKVVCISIFLGSLGSRGLKPLCSKACSTAQNQKFLGQSWAVLPKFQKAGTDRIGTRFDRKSSAAQKVLGSLPKILADLGSASALRPCGLEWVTAQTAHAGEHTPTLFHFVRLK